MTRLDDFNILVGDTLMHCQRIEHDIKIIYAAMLSGDMRDNLELIKKETLGTVLVALNALDNSDEKPLFSNADYKLLKEIKNIRNFIAHQCYVDFLYRDENGYYEKLSENFKKMRFFNEDLKNLATFVEKARFSVLSRFKLI